MGGFAIADAKRISLFHVKHCGQTDGAPAYGMVKNEDILTHLLAINHACAANEKAGEPITSPGLPLPPEDHAAFITTDCIEAPVL
jgi:hypothetical protein